MNFKDDSGIELELSSKLKQIGIVERFAFYTKTNAIMLLLNHAYDRKKSFLP
jgi:hypothetical protein